jgi:hypothetical protein
MPDDVNPLVPTRFRTERCFYDGVRRVQEVITEDLPVIVIGNPIPMQGEVEMTGEPEIGGRPWMSRLVAAVLLRMIGAICPITDNPCLSACPPHLHPLFTQLQ